MTATSDLEARVAALEATVGRLLMMLQPDAQQIVLSRGVHSLTLTPSGLVASFRGKPAVQLSGSQAGLSVHREDGSTAAVFGAKVWLSDAAPRLVFLDDDGTPRCVLGFVGPDTAGTVSSSSSASVTVAAAPSGAAVNLRDEENRATVTLSQAKSGVKLVLGDTVRIVVDPEGRPRFEGIEPKGP